MDVFTTLIVLSSSLILLSLFYFVSKYIKNIKLKNVITVISSNINSIYCIHWILVKILWVLAMIFALRLEYNSLFLTGFLIFIVSALIAGARRKN
jgi:hypothetical protein